MALSAKQRQQRVNAARRPRKKTLVRRVRTKYNKLPPPVRNTAKYVALHGAVIGGYYGGSSIIKARSTFGGAKVSPKVYAGIGFAGAKRGVVGNYRTIGQIGKAAYYRSALHGGYH